MTIYFIFVGLIAFVQDTTPGVHAILIDTSDVWYASDGTAVPHHQPFVAVNREAFTDPAQCPDDLGLRYCSAALSYEEVTVGGAALQNVPLNNSVPLAQMTAVLASTLGPRGTLLDPLPPRGIVAGRFTLDLDVGTLAGASVCQQTVKFHPIGNDTVSGNSTVPADVVWFVTTTAAKSLTLQVQKFHGATFDGGRIFTIAPKDPAKPVYVVIGNMDMNPCVADKEGFDRHFEMFYELAAEEPWSHNRPVPYSDAAPNAANLPPWLCSAMTGIGASTNCVAFAPIAALRSACPWHIGTGCQGLGLAESFILCTQGLNERAICPMVGY